MAYGSNPEELDILFQGNQIPENTYSVAEAQAMANGLITQIAPDLKLISICSNEPFYVYPDEDVERNSDPDDPFTIDTSLTEYLCIPAYVFTYAREIDEILVTYTTTRCGSSPDSYANVPDYERCVVTISNRGFESVLYSNPMQIGGTIQPTAQLLPFDDITSVLKSVMPIAYDALYSNPNNDAITFTIDRITLGYIRTPVKGTDNAYQLIPVWDFFGIGKEAKVEGFLNSLKSPNISLFTINAMDGTVIDRSYGY